MFFFFKKINLNYASLLGIKYDEIFIFSAIADKPIITFSNFTHGFIS